MFSLRSDWLLNQWTSRTIHWFTSSSLERATPNSRKLRAKCLPGLLPQQTKKFHWQLIKQAVPEIHKEGDEVRFGIFTQVKLCLFDLNLSIKPVKKFFVYWCKLSLSLSLLYLVDLFINKLQTKFDNLFYRMIKNSQLVWRNFPARARKMPSKVYLSARKSDDRGRSVMARQNYNRWQQ